MKREEKCSLRKQFSSRILTVFLIIAIISGVLQIYFIHQQVNVAIENQSSLIAKSIDQGIKATNLASQEIEAQIDLKLAATAKHIGDLINKERAADITKEELVKMRDALNLAGISIYMKKGQSMVVVQATDPADLGYNPEEHGIEVSNVVDALFSGSEPEVVEAYTDKGLLVLPIVHSDVHDKPKFFKYAYFQVEGTDYVINPYIEAREVSQLTEKVGPNLWIEVMKADNALVREIAVLDPELYKNQELEKQVYPPRKKIVFGDDITLSKEDVQTLITMVDNPVKQTNVQKINGDKYLKLFLPIDHGKAIYISLDYQQMTAPIYQHSTILVISGFVSMLALFLITIKFFEKIYEHIQKIINQIRLLEQGDLTIKSQIQNGGELSSLSVTINIMVDKLSTFIKDTQEQANKTQQLSEKLEEEAAHSVEKIYEISTEKTIKAREQLYEITEYLDQIEHLLAPNRQNEKVKELLETTELMRHIANERTASTTIMTITLSDLLKSLYEQSRELSEISNTLFDKMGNFKL
ncbi:methyl-accepting chemotaxis protein [Robertmurraya massiliosenegalensis]|uniref:methyl-accepting chemotaxis protein n=1 Tax=Robertmurraya TaxID=2837507 RepID=UPI0039A661CA